MKRLLIALLLAASACDKTAKVGPDTPSTPSTGSPPVAATTPPTATVQMLMPPVAMPAAGEVKRLAASSNALGFDIYGKVRSTAGNLAMSPASISAALAMTYGGARGETEAQMKRVLHLEGSRDSVMADWGSLSRGLQDPARPLKLRIANRLFGEKSVKLEPLFLDKTRDAYGAPLEPTDFKNAFEPARAHINGWVEEQTEHRIKNLLPPHSLDSVTRLVLVNAIYFLADWADPFEKNATRDETFNVSATVQKKTPMMHHGGSYRLTQADGVKVLEVPYRGGDAAMLVILPDRADGLGAVETSLTAAKLDAWMAALAPQNVAVTLPRFEVSPRVSMTLADELVKLGMRDAFDGTKSDFTGIANPADVRERLKIDQVFHKAFVKVDEKGTEAAAATAVAMGPGGGAPRPMLELKVDHPFVFAIVDKTSGLVLFLGRVADPTTR